MTTSEFLNFLANLKSVIVVFEACSTSNYWKQKASSLGHDARMICPKFVLSVRQNQKTDKNDALVVVQAALLPDVNFISGKNIEQQQLQSIMRFRELAIKQKNALGNQLKGLLLELNIRVSSRNGVLKSVIQSNLEDGENDLSFEFRSSLKMAWIQALVARRGKRCTAVVLTNKTVRTTFAMLTQGTEYKAELITA